jgi:hypothetical protein
MRIVKWRSGAECGAALAIEKREKVEIDVGRFSVMATVQWGMGATFGCQQTHLCDDGL